MNLILGILLPLANERRNFFKVSPRFQCQNDLQTSRSQGVLKTFNNIEVNQKSQVFQSPSLQSNLVDKILKFNDGYIKKNKACPRKQQLNLGSYKISLFVSRDKMCKMNCDSICTVTSQVFLNSKTQMLVKTLVLASSSLGFSQSCGKHICSTRPCIHLNMVFKGQPVARLQLAEKGTVKPSEIFSLLGLDAQNLADSPLEQLGLNPVF